MIVWSIAALHPADAMNLARAAGTAELTLSIEAVELTLAVEAASCVQSQISPAADAAELARAEPDLDRDGGGAHPRRVAARSLRRWQQGRHAAIGAKIGIGAG